MNTICLYLARKSFRWIKNIHTNMHVFLQFLMHKQNYMYKLLTHIKIMDVT